MCGLYKYKIRGIDQNKERGRHTSVASAGVNGTSASSTPYPDMNRINDFNAFNPYLVSKLKSLMDMFLAPTITYWVIHKDSYKGKYR